jgi:hypothetical protein
VAQALQELLTARPGLTQLVLMAVRPGWEKPGPCPHGDDCRKAAKALTASVDAVRGVAGRSGEPDKDDSLKVSAEAAAADGAITGSSTGQGNVTGRGQPSSLQLLEVGAALEDFREWSAMSEFDFGHPVWGVFGPGDKLFETCEW